MPTQILVVEDSATQAEALRALLEREGYVVTVAASGEEALGLIPGGEFHLVLSDIVMPGISGYELCQRVKTELARSDLPVVLLTGLTDPRDIVRGLECGADNYITKPYEPGQLVSRVRSVLDNFELRRGVRSDLGVRLAFMGATLTITSGKEQILDLLMASFEDVVRTNVALRESERQLAEAHAQLQAYSRRLANQARVAGEKYWALMQHASDAIFVLDESGRILEANARGTELLGRPLDDLMERRLESFLVEDELEYCRMQFARLRDAGRIAMSDLHLVHSAGHVVACDLSAALAPGNQEQRVLAILRDVTGRNQHQRQLVQAEKLAAIGTLVAGIAHEINNPVAFLMLNAERLLDWAKEVEALGVRGLEERARELGELARESLEASQRIGNIVRDLKAFARADEDDLAEVNVNTCVDSAAAIASAEIKHRASLVKDYAELPTVVASPGRLGQVFLNLIVNAAQALEEGKPQQDQITVRTRAEGDWVVVSVSDTGKGIAPADRERLFEPFFTTKPAGAGTGLGLYVSRQIVSGYGGDIEVASEPGRGTTFTVRIPRQTGRRLPAPALAAAAPPPAPRQRVLLVDDEAQLLRAFERALGRRHDVTAALGGRRALEILGSASEPFDVVVSDLLMPDVDGIDLYAYLRDHRPDLTGRTVFMTGGAATLRAREFLASLGAPWLEKPFPVEELMRRVDDVARGVAS